MVCKEVQETTLQVALGQAESARRPEAKERLSYEVLLGHRPEKAGVEGEFARLSPITKTWSLGTVSGPKEQVLGIPWTQGLRWR